MTNTISKEQPPYQGAISQAGRRGVWSTCHRTIRSACRGTSRAEAGYLCQRQRLHSQHVRDVRVAMRLAGKSPEWTRGQTGRQSESSALQRQIMPAGQAGLSTTYDPDRVLIRSSGSETAARASSAKRHGMKRWIWSPRTCWISKRNTGLRR